MKGWLVNDTLTCIPGTKTLWHDLLDWIPELKSPIDGYLPFAVLDNFICAKAAVEGAPDFVVRNCTFFPPLKIKTKTISILQDIYEGAERNRQIEVANNSDLVIFNSECTKSFYEQEVKTRTEVIPLGIDFDHFKPSEETHEDVLPNSILFIGAATNYPKGFDLVRELVESTNHNYCLVMKDDFSWEHPRVKVFNSVDHDELVKIINSCSLAICTSLHETQHLAGLECAACDLPIIATDVGCYFGLPSGSWGEKAVGVLGFEKAIEYVLRNKERYSPRSFFQDYDKKVIKKKWQSAIASVL